MFKILLFSLLLFCLSCKEVSFSDRNYSDLDYYDRKIDEGEFEEVFYYLENINKTDSETAYQDTVFVKFYNKYLTAVLSEVQSIDEFESPELLKLKENYFQMYLRSRK